MKILLRDGDHLWATTHFRLQCCDCGLTHWVTIDKEIKKTGKSSIVKVNKDWLILKLYVDEVMTEQARKKRGIEIKDNVVKRGKVKKKK